jgi:hypothetical protein
MNNPMVPRQSGQAQQPAQTVIQPHQVAEQADIAAYSAQAFGALVRKPELTDKDIIGTVGQAVADGKITASNAVKFLAGMPQDPAQLKPWMSQMYMQAITNAVQLRAHQAGATPSAPQQAAPLPQGQMMQPPMQASPEPPQATNPMMRA